jgi:predicted nucleotidyltransferase
MIKGVSDNQLKIIKNIISSHQNDCDFYLYGSRINGNFQTNSDLDLMIKGDEKLSFDFIESLKEKFDNSDLPFIVHISDYYEINTDFYESIKPNLLKLDD